MLPGGIDGIAPRRCITGYLEKPPFTMNTVAYHLRSWRAFHSPPIFHAICPTTEFSCLLAALRIRRTRQTETPNPLCESPA